MEDFWNAVSEPETTPILSFVIIDQPWLFPFLPYKEQSLIRDRSKPSHEKTCNLHSQCLSFHADICHSIHGEDTHERRCPQRPQAWESPTAGVTGSCELFNVLRIELWFSARALHAYNHGAISPAPVQIWPLKTIYLIFENNSNWFISILCVCLCGWGLQVS